ncbi:MAG: tol-pal system protein YbgF [Rhizobiaceae bacterium]|nr:tol-pal system protein YbgF [Rhizobiaceae bacterium]
MMRIGMAAAGLLLAGAAQATPLPSVAPNVPSTLPLIHVQTTDPRVFQLEEQVRQLNGRIEELNFMVLELQEMIRKMQKDNEFRFQELEAGKQGNAAPANPADGNAVAGGANPNAQPGTGAPPTNLGSITFDAQGNPIGAGQGGATNQAVAAGLGDAELFDSAYNLVLAGDYSDAESAFREHVSRFPQSERASDARYWLGESQLGQAKYTEAAENFLSISRDYPQAARAPEALLKLGVSMAALNKNDIACATFNEVMRRYPQAGAALQSRVDTEKAAAQC